MRYPELDLGTAAIRASQIAVPLVEARGVALEDDVGSVGMSMAAAQFDTAPVMADGVPLGVFSRVAGSVGPGVTVKDRMRPLAAELIVSGLVVVDQLMERMRAEPFLFVLEEKGITGFITPADLGTVPVRTHFYLRLAHLESTLGSYLRVRYPEQRQAVALLPEGRRDAQAKLADELRSTDTFIDDLACLSLKDLLDIAGKDTAFRAAVAGSGVGWGRAAKGLANFRNDVMHPTRPLVAAGVDRPEKLLDRQHRIDALIGAVRASYKELTGTPGT